ncbi:hypothetical protein D3C72_1115320 [compost metagenome]
MPIEPRRRSDGITCQFTPTFQTLSESATLSYLNTRPEALMLSDSTAGRPFSNGTSTSTKASLTLSLPLVTSAEDEPQMSPVRDSSLGWSLSE